MNDFYARWYRGARLCATCPVRLDCLTATLTAETAASVTCAAEYVCVGYAALRAERRARYIVEHKPDPEPLGGRCGTDLGYYDHRRGGEDACRPCKDAHAATQRAAAARRRARTVEAATSVAFVEGSIMHKRVRHYDYGDRITA